jgi:hypothetical protein
MEKKLKTVLRFFSDGDFLVFLTNTVGYVLYGLSGLQYAIHLLNRDNPKLTAVGVTAFGVCAVLSNLSYRAAPLFDEKEKKLLMYSGEKFFHSSLLLIQTVVFRYAIDAFLTFKVAPDKSMWMPVITTIVMIFNVIMFLIGIFAVYFFLYGFESLNNFFWIRYRQRILASKKNKQLEP